RFAAVSLGRAAKSMIPKSGYRFSEKIMLKGQALAFAVEATVTIELPAHMHPSRSFQGLILTLHNYWAAYGCVILQPYDMEVGAGTFPPAQTLRARGHHTLTAAY